MSTRRALPKPAKKPAAARTRDEYDAERSSAMRRRILDAAFESLHEQGHARTTTVEVCRRAAVQRGTLLHHFPDRESLLVAALEHVFELRFEEFSRDFEKLGRSGAKRPAYPDARTIDLLWKTINGPGTIAWVELVVASRSDPPLSRKLRTMTRAFDAKIHQKFAELFPGVPSSRDRDPVLAPSVSFVFALMNGLVLDRLGGFEEHAPEVLNGLKHLVALLFEPEK